MRISDWSSDVCSSDLARQCDLPLLSTGLGVITLVVTTEQQDDLGPIEVNEHPEEDSLAVRARVGSVATEHLSDLVGVMSDTKLVQTVPERLQPLGTREVDP